MSICSLDKIHKVAEKELCLQFQAKVFVKTKHLLQLLVLAITHQVILKNQTNVINPTTD